jgi:hypothetical protein
VTSQDDLSSFISSSFPSVWALEVLLALKRHQRACTPQELIDSLRASELVVTQAIATLVAGGLVTVGPEGPAYMPVSGSVSELVDRTEKLYASKPDAVRRMIVLSASSGIAAFADAFKLRKD